MISDCQNPTEKNAKSRKLYLSDFRLDKEGNYTDKKNNSFKIAKKWRKLIDAPFKVSHKCCDELKKKPLKKWQKENCKKPIIGTLAEESKMREANYLKIGCNSFKEGKENCTPLGFWTEQDILNYLKINKIEYCSVYGDIKKDQSEKLYCSGEKRTGCVFCGFCKNEKQLEERYLRLEETHPKLHKYCMEDLKFKEVCNFLNIRYKKEQF